MISINISTLDIGGIVGVGMAIAVAIKKMKNKDTVAYTRSTAYTENKSKYIEVICIVKRRIIRIKMDSAGFEPAASALRRRRSAPELRALE